MRSLLLRFLIVFFLLCFCTGISVPGFLCCNFRAEISVLRFLCCNFRAVFFLLSFFCPVYCTLFIVPCFYWLYLLCRIFFVWLSLHSICVFFTCLFTTQFSPTIHPFNSPVQFSRAILLCNSPV